MKWIAEADKKQQGLNHQILLLDNNDELPVAYAELWKRILADASSSPKSSPWSAICFDIQDKQTPRDKEQGCLHANLTDSRNAWCADTAEYYVRGEQFTFLQGDKETDDSFNARQIHWLLEHYTLLKQALRNSEIQQLLAKAMATRPIEFSAATSCGWFDLQVDRDDFGQLPSEDQAMLNGLEPAESSPLSHLLPGGTDDSMVLMRELCSALVQYTPPHFKTIACQITEGVESGQRALFYKIECPEFPEDGTSAVNDRVHKAATQFVQHLSRNGKFPGIVIRMQEQSDGNWKNSFEMLQPA